MAKGEMGDSKSSIGFLVLLLIVLFSGTSSDPRSLSYNVTIHIWPGDDQPRCEVQGEIDQKVFVSCDYVKVGSGSLTLQARMTCWQEDNGHTSASLESGSNGPLYLSFYLDNGHCRVRHPGGRRMKRKRENHPDVTNFFKICEGNCLLCYQAFLEHCEKMFKTTASPTTGPAAVRPSATASKHVTWILPVLISFIPVFLG